MGSDSFDWSLVSKFYQPNFLGKLNSVNLKQ